MFIIRLKELRKAHGITQVDLAKALPVAQSTVGMWESGKREPDFNTLEKLANYFSVSTDYLLGKSDMPNPEPPPREEEKIELPEGLTYAHFNGIKELDNDDRRELIRMMERMLELDRLRKERQATRN